MKKKQNIINRLIVKVLNSLWFIICPFLNRSKSYTYACHGCGTRNYSKNEELLYCVNCECKLPLSIIRCFTICEETSYHLLLNCDYCKHYSICSNSVSEKHR